MKRLYWGFLLLPFIWNCATHVPMSEMVMFSPKKVEASYPDTIDQVYYSRLSVGLSVKQDIKSYNALRRHSDAKYQNGSIDELSYAPSVGFNTILMFTGNDYFALKYNGGILNSEPVPKEDYRACTYSLCVLYNREARFYIGWH